MQEEIRATGQIEAVQAIDLRPEISGRLVRILAREGTEVRAGRSLFKIDDAELLSQVARLEAERDLAEQEHLGHLRIAQRFGDPLDLETVL